ncbi:hypothetical protein M8998_15090 [Sphingobacterium sp. lm-10]|uniref:hypothetical protein n=1 Tax=Sphingobacterium sp. lm-10 TaxID=2944904 RepID=UPI0020215C58|nr:hypothetical protein [Sphingobacterium sp. lm-10]MCL7989274.1 hypothetical protein [Sphingobacterium sp. lm-10]
MKISKFITRKLASYAAVACTAFAFASCSSDVVDPVGPDDDGVVVLQGDITTRTLTADQKYLLRGQVFVRANQTLTIEPGTVIMGEKSTKGTLVIDRDAKIMSEGTRERPIIMTSNQAPGDRDRGDWGGLVLLGRARVNLDNPAVEGITPAVNYGGTDDNNNTGILTFLRVEFAGIELTPNNETNGITLGGVGRGTKFENIQVSYGGDDGIEWFGGSVNGKNLIVFATWDDCFDIDNGFSGKLQFGLGIRYPSYADQSESNGFEWDTDGDNNLSRFKTSTVATNFTIIGPAIDGNSINANFRHAVDLRRNVAGSIFNSVFVGYPTALRMNHLSAYNNYAGTNPDGVIQNNIFFARAAATAAGSNLTGEGANLTGITAANVLQYLQANGNTIEAGASAQTSEAYTRVGINPNLVFGRRVRTEYAINPNFAVTSGLITTKGAKFDHAKFNEAEARSAVAGGDNWKFDRAVTFVGAFGATDWTQGWTNFNPVAHVY